MKSKTQNQFNVIKSQYRLIKSLVIIALISVVFFGCDDNCEVTRTYTYYEPVYTTFDELRSSVQTVPAEPISTQGKIFMKGNYIFINEPNEGVHVIDNTDPTNPQNISFIEVPGSFDIVVKENLLYSDSYIDLVIIDISDVSNAIEVGRVKDLFSHYNSYGFYADPSAGIVTDWVEKEQVNVESNDCRTGQVYPWGMYYEDGIAYTQAEAFNTASAVAPTNPGMAGSMSRFALAKEHLFVIDEGELMSLDLTSPQSPISGEREYIGWGIETLFPSGENLFIGAQNGMHIMDISEPISPSLISTYNHVNSCDPVVVDGDYAFVTLRSGTECDGFTNQLEVINISDLSNPQVEHIYPMTNPHGLGKDGDVLFICDGGDGLKVFDTSDLSRIDVSQLAHYEGIQTYDVIPYNNRAIMIGEDGLFQYDYSDLNDIKLLSHIKISQ